MLWGGFDAAPRFTNNQRKTNDMRNTVLSIALLALLACGCKTPTPLPGQPSQIAINVAIGLQAVVPIGVAYEIQRQPDSAVYFNAAAVVIDNMASGTNYSASAVLSALNAIPGNANWQLARAVIAGGVGIYAGLANAGTFSTIDANYDLRAFAAAIRSGLPPTTVEAVKVATKPSREQYARILKR